MISLIKLTKSEKTTIKGVCEISTYFAYIAAFGAKSSLQETLKAIKSCQVGYFRNPSDFKAYWGNRKATTHIKGHYFVSCYA